MKKKMIMVGMIMTLITSMLVGCGSNNQKAEETSVEETSGTDKLKIGLIVKAVGDPFWLDLRDGAQEKADELGVELIFNAPNAETEVEKQINMLQDLISEDVDAICVAPSQADSMANTLEGADEKGIPVLWVDTAGNYDKALTFIGTGNENAAYLGGQYIANMLEEGDKAVIIRNSIGDPTGDEREAGYRRALEEKGIEVIDVKPGLGEAEAMNAMMDMLQTHEQIDAVLNIGSYMAKGAAKAIEQAGKKGEILIGSFDGVHELELIEDGTFTCTVAQSSRQMGALAVEEAVKAINGEEIEERIDSGAALITPENVEQYKIDNGIE
jgi:ribose transport system substrate-binding protein